MCIEKRGGRKQGNRKLKHLISALYGSTAGLQQIDVIGKIQHRVPWGFLCSPRTCNVSPATQSWQRSFLWQAETYLPPTSGTMLAPMRTSNSIFLGQGRAAWDVILLQQHPPAAVQLLLAFRVCTPVCIGRVFWVPAGSGIIASIMPSSAFTDFPSDHEI